MSILKMDLGDVSQNKAITPPSNNGELKEVVPIMELYISPKTKHKYENAESNSHHSSSPIPPPRTRHKVFFPTGMSLQTFTSFVNPSQSESQRESIRSVLSERVIHVTGEDIPTFYLLRVRNKFVQKVYAILTWQFLAILALLLMGTFIEPVYLFFTKYGFITLAAFLFNFLFLELLLIFCINLRRYFPVNIILMCLITFCLSMVLISSSVFYNITPYTTYGTSLTAFIFFIMSTIACQDRWDVTSSLICCIIFTCTGTVTGIALIFMIVIQHKEYILNMVIVSSVILLFILWLIHITRQIVINDKEYLSPTEYIFGAITLFIHILLIFMFVVELIKYCLKSLYCLLFYLHEP